MGRDSLWAGRRPRLIYYRAQDLEDFVSLALGPRIESIFIKIFEANVLGALTYGKYLVTYYLSYIPKDSGSGITSSTAMLFLSVEVAM